MASVWTSLPILLIVGSATTHVLPLHHVNLECVATTKFSDKCYKTHVHVHSHVHLQPHSQAFEYLKPWVCVVTTNFSVTSSIPPITTHPSEPTMPTSFDSRSLTCLFVNFKVLIPTSLSLQESSCLSPCMSTRLAFQVYQKIVFIYVIKVRHFGQLLHSCVLKSFPPIIFLEVTQMTIFHAQTFVLYHQH